MSAIGLLQRVIDHARIHDQGGGSIFKRVENDIIRQAQNNGQGSFSYTFTRGYNFENVAFEIRGATVSGQGPVLVREREKFLIITADVNYTFSDVFTDVLNIREILIRLEQRLDKLRDGVAKSRLIGFLREQQKIPEGEVGQFDLPFSMAYPITDTWRTRIEAVIKKRLLKSD